MYIPESEFPLPKEFSFIDLAGHSKVVPNDASQRAFIFLDCGAIDRNPAFESSSDATAVINIDHHQTNSRFGSDNYVVDSAACTAELVWNLAKKLNVEVTKEMAESLYLGLVTDTGKFMHANTGPVAHQMAAELIERGVDAAEMSSLIYEGVPYVKLKLVARALENSQRHCQDALIISFLNCSDLTAVGATEAHHEGIIDYLRAVEGTAIAALVKELKDGAWKVSLRAAREDVDVSVVATKLGGGGHAQAAGFTTTMDPTETLNELKLATNLVLDKP